MARSRHTAGSVMGFAAGVWIVMGMASAQQTAPPPSTPPVAGSPLPGASDLPQAVPPGGPGAGSSGTQVTSGPGPGFPGGAQPVSMPVPQRFTFKIDPKTPTKDLLPTPPVVTRPTGPVLTDDLAKVSEVEFQARPEKISADGKLTEQTAHQLAKINHLNAKKTDAFMTALLANRADLSGLPFAMGDSCRTVGERTRQFTIAVNTVRQALGGNRFVLNSRLNADMSGPGAGPQGSSGGAPPAQQAGLLAPPGMVQAVPPPSSNFWTQFPAICEQQDAANSRTDKDLREHATVARIAALMQMFASESAEMRLGLVKYLTGVPHVEATRALAKLAIFSSEDDVRLAAIESLKVRREKDYTDILVRGLRYPWPAVAKRSADAIARMERTDLIPELVAVLAQDDPRLPVIQEKEGKKVPAVREMVKINHHRNCMMCHPPGNPSTVSSNAITAEVPVQGQPLPSPLEGYRQSSPDLMIRIDATYLRQDFSALLPVADAQPWPDSQRFDFFVRERKLTDEEAALYRDRLTPKEAGVLSPYHKAALAALRELTGKDTTPTAEAWRKLLGERALAVTTGPSRRRAGE